MMIKEDAHDDDDGFHQQFDATSSVMVMEKTMSLLKLVKQQKRLITWLLINK